MKFIEQPHSYITDSGEQYLSVTSLIKKYEPYKDWDQIAAKYAKKHKRDVEEVRAEWKEEGRKGIERGIAYHALKEQEYVSQGVVDIEGTGYPVIFSPMEDGVKLAIPLKLEDGIYPEIIIHSNKYKVGGQADLVEVRGGQIHVKDYKTSKSIDRESFKNWQGKYEMLLPPVGNLMNCKYYTYGLQINIYMYLLRQHNPHLNVGNMEIHHVKENSVDIISVPNLQKEARAVLEDYYEQQVYSF